MPSAVTVVRAGFAPMKGTRHLSLDAVQLDAHGPVGDREWCLVDEHDQVLRTTAHPLMGVTVESDGSGVTLSFPDGRTASQRADPSGVRRVVDYWGRAAEVTAYDGGVGELLSSLLGRPVQLARAERGQVVYGAPVSLIGTASVRDLAERIGHDAMIEQPARFRSTFVVETDEPWVEDSWVGRYVALADAVVRVHAPIGRCGVVNLDPLTGTRDTGVLKALASFRPANAQGEPLAAVDAVVVRPGTVGVGATVRLVPVTET